MKKKAGASCHQNKAVWGVGFVSFCRRELPLNAPYEDSRREGGKCDVNGFQTPAAHGRVALTALSDKCNYMCPCPIPTSGH